MKICSVENCNKKFSAKGLCRAHRMRLYRYGNPLGKPIKKEKSNKLCTIENCSNKFHAKGYCNKHYSTYTNNLLVTKDSKVRKCSLFDCQFKHFANSYCRKHYLSIFSKTPISRYKVLINTAKHRKIQCTISFEEFLQFENLTCHYCNDEITSKGSSLDRIDSKIGYVLSNVVKCCAPCNYLKNDYVSYEEMLEIVTLLKKLRKKENIWKKENNI